MSRPATAPGGARSGEPATRASTWLGPGPRPGAAASRDRADLAPRAKIVAQRDRGGRMSGRFEGSSVVDRPIDEVFAFLAEGTNDPQFSPRVVEIAKTTDGPPGPGTRFSSTVKDAGMTTKRE